MFYRVVLCIMLLLAVVAPVAAQDGNLTDGCVTDFDPTVDYFPDKAEIEYAAGLEIEYHNHYKIARVTNPWRGAEVNFEYVLVQCGTPVPDGFEQAQIIEVPVESVVTMSTTQLPQLVALDELDALVGLDSFAFVNTPAVRDLIEAAVVTETGAGSTMNIELILALEPDMVLTYSVGNPSSDSHPALLEQGIDAIIAAAWMETSPLGYAEWIKFTSLFFNKEAEANAHFADITAEYQQLAEISADIGDRPTVMVSAPFEGTWYVSGGDSYFAQLLADAGADYLWADDDTTGSIPLDFEAVFDRAVDADFWLNTSSWLSLNDGLSADERFAEFAAFQAGSVYNRNARLNEFGGNDYWESGVNNPHLILADLIHIFHPDLLPDHELYFYQQLPATGE